jgi:fused signal recognition particle receptor
MLFFGRKKKKEAELKAEMQAKLQAEQLKLEQELSKQQVQDQAGQKATDEQQIFSASQLEEPFQPVQAEQQITDEQSVSVEKLQQENLGQEQSFSDTVNSAQTEQTDAQQVQIEPQSDQDADVSKAVKFHVFDKMDTAKKRQVESILKEKNESQIKIKVDQIVKQQHKRIEKENLIRDAKLQSDRVAKEQAQKVAKEQVEQIISDIKLEKNTQQKKRLGFFGKLKLALKKTKDSFVFKLNNLFTGGVLNDDFYEELESILITSDMGVSATEEILEQLKVEINKKHITNPQDCKDILKQIITDMLSRWDIPEIEYPTVIMLVGVNGVGKTTALGKLANMFRQMGKTVTLVAADTFRAAASSQLEIWADRAKVRIIKHDEGADPGTVVYDAIASAKARNTQVLLVDTAGRLHNKKNLMDELKKIVKVVHNNMPNAQFLSYIVLDATTGQNALAQVEAFDEIVDIDGIILTKLDGTAKGGVVVAISEELQKPVVYVGVGEGIDDIEDFVAKEFVSGILD